MPLFCRNPDFFSLDWRGGRPLKTDTADFRYSMNFTAEEHARFLTMFEQSGLQSKARFIKARVFGDTFRVIKTDDGTLKFGDKLTQFYSQFRAVGTNYNQVVKQLHIQFSQKNALNLLGKLEELTAELYAVGCRVIELSEEFCRRWT
ncbi:MAG: MobA protein [Rikenellaceae bacterium]|jgi:hypothetical protein|nr:MobA protein [Rikenellaceae bacterium]